MNAAPSLCPELLATCRQLVTEFHQIPQERRRLLEQLANYLIAKYRAGKTPQVTVICTHNSRRSHMGQLWLAAGADFFGLPELRSFSGGTEATAFNPRAVDALRAVGFWIETEVAGDNPRYAVCWQKAQEPYRAFSKAYVTPPNPVENFAAIMVCTEADAECPYVMGCDYRLALPYHDPKAADGTPEEAARYLERAHDIGREILYCLNHSCRSLKTDATSPVASETLDCGECVAV